MQRSGQTGNQHGTNDGHCDRKAGGHVADGALAHYRFRLIRFGYVFG